MAQNNYQKFLQTINQIDKSKKPSLLLHVCCAPCSTACLEVLKDYFNITVFYYNPNIAPFSEYQKRLDEEKRLLNTLYPSIKIIEVGYDNNKFEQIVQGLENLLEGG